ncbi:chromosome assembly protein [Thermococcus aciditolerans]|uniref:Chromosome assembly protein n=1 Tax=Thermococcus aciditolerans TaxID=2598455 RepID=A0A5C0SK76_9EURY|nr:chromosome assembly protein [Thermococcus aciditolerans]QEK14166.1 chromosome assembly protein [Thermococcus aciditolerans]
MGILDRFRKNPIEKLSLRELQEEEIRLRNRLERTKKEIERIEKKKKQLFQEGIGADVLKKKMLAQEIKSLDMEQKLRLRDFTTAQKQYTFVKNLIVVKKYEKELRKIGLWDKLSKVEPEQLESVLVKVTLDGREFDEMVESLNRVFEMDIAEFEGTEDQTERELMEAWARVETGEADIEQVASEVASPKLEKETEEEL